MSDGPTSRLPLWLIVSLLVNALLIGLLIGGGLGQRKAGPGPVTVGSEQALMRGIDRALPAAQQREVRQAFRRAFQDSRSERVRLNNARRRIGRLLTADPYDAEAVQAGFAEMRAADDAMKARMHDLLAEQLGSLTQAQRRALIRDFNRSGPGPRRGDEDRPPPPRPFRDRN